MFHKIYIGFIRKKRNFDAVSALFKNFYQNIFDACNTEIFLIFWLIFIFIAHSFDTALLAVPFQEFRFCLYNALRKKGLDTKLILY